MSVASRAQAIGWRSTKRLRGEAATYRVASLELSVTAVPGSTKSETSDSVGFTVAGRVHDWLVEAAELVEDSEQFEPEPGHTLTVTSSEGTDHTFEVLPPAEGMECWRWHIRDAGVMRIHTKQIDAE